MIHPAKPIVDGLAAFRRANVARCDIDFHLLESWSESEWCLAACGELGEAANIIKKRLRGEPIPIEVVAAELADTVTYIDLLAARMGIDLGAALVAKFNVVSDRIHSKTRFDLNI